MVTLVCGPPCSGKSTLVRTLAQPDDVVLDFDDICVELGSTHQWAHSKQVRVQAEALMQRRIHHLAGMGQASGYVIRTAPLPKQRVDLATLLGATVWVLNPGLAECMRRARTRPRGTAKAIRWWYARYAPAPVDTPCPWVQVAPQVPLPTSRAW